jgi:large subunit ribosomal protein L23
MSLIVLKKPVITEKSLHAANARNMFTFEVDRHATKDQIKTAVEKTYSVKVASVNTTTRSADVERTGRRRLNRTVAPVKKAIVTLKAGHTIDVFDIYNEK